MDAGMRQALLQSAVLNVASTLIAQLLKAYRSGAGLSLQALDGRSLLQFLALCLLLTPPNVYWQRFLESRFPGYPVKEGMQKFKVDDDGKGVVVENRLDTKNTTIKFLLDQTVGAWGNTAGFIVAFTLIQGGGLDDCYSTLFNDFRSLQWTGYKFWPLVSLVNFLLVPAERRVVVGAAAGLFWNVYMVMRMTG